MGVCVVTGATGYVGSRVGRRLEAAGWTVRPLGRTQGFALGSAPPPGALDGAQGLVHCAWDFGLARAADAERVNVNGSKELFGAARDAGIPHIVFLSTLSAFPGCRSIYGKTKLAAEAGAAAVDASIVRAGLVWGDDAGSLHGSLRRLARRLPLLPVFSDRKLHLAHEDDLGDLVANLLERSPADTPVVGAAEAPLSLAEILRVEGARVGRTPRIVRIPWQLVWLPLRLLEALGLQPPFRSDSVLSLTSLDQLPFEHAAAPPTAFRPFA